MPNDNDIYEVIENYLMTKPGYIYHDDSRFKAVMYASLSSLERDLLQDLAIVTIDDEAIGFYMLNKTLNRMIIDRDFKIMIEDVTDAEKTNCIIFTNVNLYYGRGDQDRKIKIKIPHKALNLKKQKDSIKYFIQLLKNMEAIDVKPDYDTKEFD